MSDRYQTVPPFALTGDARRDWLELERRLVPEMIEIADTGAADSVNVVRHGLGRIPRKVMIARQHVGSGTKPVAWYNKDEDDAWTVALVNLRFDVANARVLLEVV